MKGVTEKQEELQMTFLDTLERREKESVATEEAWTTQETQLNEEHDMLVNESSVCGCKNCFYYHVFFTENERKEQRWGLDNHQQSKRKVNSVAATEHVGSSRAENQGNETIILRDYISSKQSSARLQKIVFDRMIFELEKKVATKRSSTNEVFHTINDISS
ncbi:hypothetical protein Tco_1273211 [Tanacetum coccineum]